MDINNYKSIIGQKVKHLRLSENMTQEEFCNSIDLEISNLSNIENGKTLPSFQTIVKILAIFQTEPNEFFNFVNWNEEPENPLNLEINERIKLLPDDLKTNLLEVIKSLKP